MGVGWGREKNNPDAGLSTARKVYYRLEISLKSYVLASYYKEFYT